MTRGALTLVRSGRRLMVRPALSVSGFGLAPLRVGGFGSVPSDAAALRARVTVSTSAASERSAQRATSA